MMLYGWLEYPATQAVVGRRALEKQASSTNTLSRFEIEALVTEDSRGCGALLACRGLLQGSEREIDNQIPWIYYW